MFPYLFSVGSEANVKQCVLFVLGRPAVYLLFISIIRNETCTFRISYNNSYRLKIRYVCLEYNIQFTCLTNNYYYICIVQIAQLRCLTDSFRKNLENL